VTNPRATSGFGIAIDAKQVKVRGNQVIGDSRAAPPGTGILTIEGNPGPMLIEGNQVMLWGLAGIAARGAGKTVGKNQVSLNGDGIDVQGPSSATDNVVSGNSQGIRLSTTGRAVGNAVYGNGVIGLFLPGPPFSGTIAGNNISGNGELFPGNCGLENDGVLGLMAANNYWGAPTGPGPNPADDVCNLTGGTTITAPFATTPFRVKAPIKP